MAEKKPEAGEGEQPAPKKKTKLIIIIAVAVVVLLLVVVGGVMLMKKNSSQAAEEGDGTAQAEKPKPAHEEPPVFVKLEPFTVKLQTDNQDAYLQTTPELRVLDAAAGEKVKQYMPEIRYHVLQILMSRKASEVSTPQGMQQLSTEIRDSINDTVGEARRKKPTGAAADKAGPDDPVQAVLFTSFIVQ